MIIIDGRSIADKIKDKLKKEVEKLKEPPVLAAILVGDDPASQLYIKIKEKTAQYIGIGFKKFLLPKNCNQDKITNLIKKLNNNHDISGIIIQLPFPEHLNTENIISLIASKKDVDALKRQSKFQPPTLNAILEIFKYYKITLKNKNIVVVGHGKLVGKPLIKYLKDKKLKPTVCTKNTKNIGLKTLQADILISGVGAPHLIKKNMVKKEAVIIDAGTAVEKSNKSKKSFKTLGDVDFENVKTKASYITPSVGGVGPITVAKLLENVVKAGKTN